MSDKCSFDPDIFWFMSKNVLWQQTQPVSPSQNEYCSLLITHAYGIDTKWDGGYLKHIRKCNVASDKNGLVLFVDDKCTPAQPPCQTELPLEFSCGACCTDADADAGSLSTGPARSALTNSISTYPMPDADTKLRTEFILHF